MFTVESKSQLAKLLASENLTVEHKKIPTAYFDLKARTLACPIWKDMSGDLYDLLMGHEVGHALYTPEAGWHDAICAEGKKFKSFLNVIEDARIEKKIKRKYPGIKSSFLRAYGELLDRDFFGLSKRDMEIIPFIDKINLFTKTGMYFEFTDDEQQMVDRVLMCETWEDVVASAKEIFEYSKDEQKSILEQYFSEPSFSDFDEDDESVSFDDYDESTDEGDELTEDTFQSSGEQSEDESEESEDGDVDYQKSFDSDGEESNFEPVCETDEHYRQNETQLLDESSKEYIYADIPKPIIKNIITPYKIVHKHMSDLFEYRYSENVLNGVYKSFRKKNEKYISLLAKEFEMRKSARAYLKNKTSDTGDIDINKIFRYQFDDNIFRKVTIQPKGKSHGLVLLLDHSSSMLPNFGASLEQVIILSMFCKKINIPFVVYSFVSHNGVRMIDFPEELLHNRRDLNPCFEQQSNCLSLERVFLREYLNSSMNLVDYNRCIKNLTMMAKIFNEKHYYRVPNAESFGSTPLIESMVVLKEIAKKFKKDNNLDIINTVIVHDGDSDRVDCFKDSEGIKKKFSTTRHNVYINDKSEKIQIKLENDEHPYFDYDYAIKNAIFEWYKKTTGSKIFGFFIVGQGTNAKRNISYNYRTKENKSLIDGYERRSIIYNNSFDNVIKNFKEQKFLESYNRGYDTFYFIPGGKDLNVTEDELTVTGDITKGKLKTAFVKMGKKKQTNRILVNRFIAGIA